MRIRSTVRRTAFLGLVVASVGACGSDATSASAHGSLTATESQTIASQAFAAAFSGLSNATFSSLRAGAASLLSPTATFTGECAGAGTSSGTVTYDYSVDSHGTGSESATVALTEHSCGVSTGTRTVVIDGTLTFSFNVSLSSYALSNYGATAHGSFSWSGGSCDLNYNVSMTGTGHYSISGSVCGYDISGTY